MAGESTASKLAAYPGAGDPRLNGRVPQLLLGSDVSSVPLPLPLSVGPSWVVPLGTGSLTVAAQGTVITMEVSARNGDPNLLGISSGTVTVANLTAPEIAPGLFFGLPEGAGPLPVGGVGSGAKVNLAALANTNPFDSSMSSSTGDAWGEKRQSKRLLRAAESRCGSDRRDRADLHSDCVEGNRGAWLYRRRHAEPGDDQRGRAEADPLHVPR